MRFFRCVDRCVKKVPAGWAILPLFLGIILNIAIKEPTSSKQYDGYIGVARIIITVVLMVLIFVMCTKINFRKVGKPLLYRGGMLLGLKLLISAGLTFILIAIVGKTGTIIGISAVAVIVALSTVNVMLFAAIGRSYGEEDDVPSIAPLFLTNGPLFTVLVLSASGVANVDIMAIMYPLIAMVAGILVGNVFPKFVPYLAKGVPFIMPVFMLLLGTTISAWQAIQGGAQGLVLGVIALAAGILAFFVSRLYMGKGRRSPVAMSTGTVGATAISIPAFIANFGGISQELATSAASQIAGAVIITAIFAPIITMLLFKWEQRRRIKNNIPPIITQCEAECACVIPAPETQETVENN